MDITLTPQVTTQEQAVVIIRWTEPDPNGPGDLSYNVTRDGERVCGPTTLPQCTDAQVSYDGKKHVYRVKATNGVGDDDHSSYAEKEWDATGIPDQPEKPEATATGTDHQVRVTGRVKAARGSQARLRILANGEEVFSGPIRPQSGFDTKVLLKGNNIPTEIKAQLCNEHTCGPESAATEASAYGPIKDLTIRDAGRNGQTVSYAVSVDPNGRPVVVTVNGKEFQTGPSGPWTTIQTVDLKEWGASEVFVATATDGTRKAGPVSVKLTAEPPPPPRKVKVIRGKTVHDPRCAKGKCGLIEVETSGFPGEVRCSITDSDLAGAWGKPWKQGGNTRALAGGQFYGGKWITVTCDGVSGTNDDWQDQD